MYSKFTNDSNCKATPRHLELLGARQEWTTMNPTDVEVPEICVILSHQGTVVQYDTPYDEGGCTIPV